MADTLTPKEEGWVQDAFIGTSYSQAYRNHYDTSGCTDKSVNELASRLASKVKIASRLIELQEEAAERSQVTIASITKELEEARAMAIAEAQPAAMTGASMGKAKVNGLLIEKAEVKVVADVNFHGKECDL